MLALFIYYFSNDVCYFLSVEFKHFTVEPLSLFQIFSVFQSGPCTMSLHRKYYIVTCLLRMKLPVTLESFRMLIFISLSFWNMYCTRPNVENKTNTRKLSSIMFCWKTLTYIKFISYSHGVFLTLRLWIKPELL